MDTIVGAKSVATEAILRLEKKINLTIQGRAKVFVAECSKKRN
jgi:hypothetical protein